VYRSAVIQMTERKRSKILNTFFSFKSTSIGGRKPGRLRSSWLHGKTLVVFVVFVHHCTHTGHTQLTVLGAFVQNAQRLMIVKDGE